MPRKFAESVANAWRGILFSFRTQRNLSIHFLIAAAVIILGIILNLSYIEMAIIVLAISGVIVLELINTALEEIVNLMILSRKMRAMVAKDVSAAAVFVAVLASVIVGVIIFVPKIVNVIFRILT